MTWPKLLFYLVPLPCPEGPRAGLALTPPPVTNPRPRPRSPLGLSHVCLSVYSPFPSLPPDDCCKCLAHIFIFIQCARIFLGQGL